ncbi:MAG: hypothetical protein KKI09_09600 [Spirochaetes bacterium]|nr:hypothetical protein [Spirochaetota bacterium]MBU0955669.1 hypothetical protein [Spirochaetota bacterium]
MNAVNTGIVPGAFERYAALERNFSSFYPNLLSTFQNLVRDLGGPVSLDAASVDQLGALVVGTRSLLPDSSAIFQALQHGELASFTRILCALHAASPAHASRFLAWYRQTGGQTPAAVVAVSGGGQTPQLARPISGGGLTPPLAGSVFAGGLTPLEPSFLAYAGSAAARRDAKARLFGWCFCGLEMADGLAMLEGFRLFGEQSPGQIDELAHSLEQHFARRSLAELKTWLWRGFALVKSGRSEDASAFLSLRTRDSRAFLGLHGSLLREEREVLRIYSTSRAGRELNIVSLEISAYQASCSYTDGQSLFLPAEISCFADNELNRQAYPAMAALLAGLVQSGTYGFDLTRSELRFSISQRYGGMLPSLKTNLVREYGSRLKTIRERRGNILEAVFRNGRSLVVLETDIEKFCYSFPSPVFMRQLFTLLELTRVQFQLSLRYAGLKQDFERMDAALLSQVPLVPVRAQQAGGDSQNHLFQLLLRASQLLRLNAPAAITTAGVADDRTRQLIARMRPLFEALRTPAATVDQTAASAFELYNIFYDNVSLAACLSRSDSVQRWHNPLDPELEPAIVAAHSPDLFPSHPARSLKSSEDEDENNFVDLTRMNEVDKNGEEQRRDIDSQELKLYAYPEFDCDCQQYRPRHCVLRERRVLDGDEDWYQAQLAEHQQLLARMVKKFLSIQPEEVELTRRWYDGDEVHLGDAVDYAVDLLRGATGDDRIYQRKTVNTRSVGMQVLIDASSSTREEVNGRRIIDIEKSALALLGAALDRIGDSFSIAAYNSNGPTAVSFFLVKDFDERWTARVRGRLSRIGPWSANRDGCAIRHAAMRLRQLDCKTKILLILSDGIPADKDYGKSDGSALVPYALEDTRRAILEARRSGIVPFCLTIDKEAKDYIGHLYGDYSYSVLSDLSLLPQRLARLYLRLTR